MRSQANHIAFHAAIPAALGAALCFCPASASIPDSAHPDFILKEVPLTSQYKTMGMGFLPDGQMVLATSDFRGEGEIPPARGIKQKVLLVSGVTGAAMNPVVKEIANTWYQPSGVTLVGSKIYISDRDGFYEILDNNFNGDLALNRKKIASWPDEGKWGPNGVGWHQWVFTPMYYQGSFYAPYSGSIRMGGPSDVPSTGSNSGAFLKWGLDGKLENFAGGLRSPNGANIGPDGTMLVADNQGSWVPHSTLMHMKQGKFYGHRQTNNPPNWAESLPYEPPVAWLPQGTLRTSPTQPVYIPEGTFAGDWLLGDANNYGLVRIFMDKVKDGLHGAVFWFGKGTGNAAINRMAWGPDKSLYMGTLASIGNWPDLPLRPIYKLSPKEGSLTFDMRAVRLLTDGVEIEFTKPVDKNTLATGNFAVSHWGYTRSAGYGVGQQASQNLTVSATQASTDAKRIHLKIAGLTADRTVYIRLNNVKGAAGEKPWNNEVWYTMNKLSDKAWNPATVSVAERARPSRLEGLVLERAISPGVLGVKVDLPGSFVLSLRTLDGSIVDEVKGNESGEYRLTRKGGAPGLFLLQVRKGEDLVSRLTIF